MLCVITGHKILQDGAAFPDLQLLAMLVRVDESWNPTVGVDIQEPLFFLLVFENVDGSYLCI